VSTVATISYVVLALAAVACLIRLALGPTVPDRVVALDTLLYVVVLGIAVAAVTERDGSYLGVLLAAALLAFVGTVTVARYVERRGEQ
jgi:multicomponent Na+:H+ antiporter subunit F